MLRWPLQTNVLAEHQSVSVSMDNIYSIYNMSMYAVCCCVCVRVHGYVCVLSLYVCVCGCIVCTCMYVPSVCIVCGAYTVWA